MKSIIRFLAITIVSLSVCSCKCCPVDAANAGIIIAVIFGVAQIAGSVLVLISSIVSNRNGRLRDKQENYRNKIKRYAKQIVFLRYVEESVYQELSRANSDYPNSEIKKKIHSCIADSTGIKYESMDSDVKRDIEDGREIKPIDISAYIQ